MIIRASVIGASGYTGVELIRLLNSHPNIAISHLVSETYKDDAVGNIFPHLAKVVKDTFKTLDINVLAKNSDVVFLALPHTKAAIMAKELLAHRHCRVIDLSADLRLNDGSVYEQWYEHTAADSALLNQAVYGLSEIGLSKQITNSQLVANPGCYPTASLLALAPLLSTVLNCNTCVIDDSITFILDAKSGISGSGRSLNLGTHFCEVMNNFSAYKIAGVHRHIPEIEQELSKLANKKITIQFTPHLIPTPRGLMVTTYCKLQHKVKMEDVLQLYNNYYEDSYFVRVNATEKCPGIKSVIGSNFCDITLHFDTRTNFLIIISVIDNLIKGASGQAIQNMNLMYGFAEQTGLEATGTYP